jgi:hypothetical protein
MAKSPQFDAQFIYEAAGFFEKFTADELDFMSAVSLDRELRDRYDRATIRRLENIAWKVCVAKRAAA